MCDKTGEDVDGEVGDCGVGGELAWDDGGGVWGAVFGGEEGVWAVGE